jgi:hypothetical protein
MIRFFCELAKLNVISNDEIFKIFDELIQNNNEYSIYLILINFVYIGKIYKL